MLLQNRRFLATLTLAAATAAVALRGQQTKPAAPQPQKMQKTGFLAKSENGLDAVNAAAKSMQSDAPACNTCGHITIRSGTCYKCLNCGNSMGCS